MSANGTVPINSGPLIARLNQDTLLSGTYLVGTLNHSEKPVDPNYVLITSTNGLLAPSNRPFFSTVNVPTSIASSITLFAFTRSSLTVPTTYASTLLTTNASFQLMSGSSMNTDNVTTAFISSLSFNMNVTTLSSLNGNWITSDHVEYNNSLVSNTTLISTCSISTIYGSGMFSTNTLTSNQISTNLIVGNTLSTSIFSTNRLIISSYSTNVVSSYNHIESTITQNTIWVSSIIASSFSTTNLSFSLFNALYPITINLVASNMVYSSMYGSTIYGSTLFGSTTTIAQLSTSFMTFSSMIGTSINTSTLVASTTSLTSITGTNANYSTLSGSTIFTSTNNVYTLNVYQYNASTINVSMILCQLNAISSNTVSSMYVSTLLGNINYIGIYNASTISTMIVTNNMTYSTIFVPYVSTTNMFVTNGTYSTIYGSTFYSSTMITSSIIPSTTTLSTCVASTFKCPIMYISTIYGSTCVFINSIISTNIVSSLVISTITSNSTIFNSSINVSSLIQPSYSISTLNVSSINGISLGLGSGQIATNTAVGYQTLVNNTTGNANTSMGYQALTNTTIGSYQTAYGTGTLSLNLSGSYHTAVGSGAGYLPGFSGSYTTYIGYQAIPSGNAVTNEIVIGGSNTTIGFNKGSGNHSITLGNAGIVNTTLYGNIGIGTTNPTTMLDVRGSYQQIGGGMKIINNNQYSQLFTISDGGVIGCGLFLNTSVRSLDGGPYTGTFRNDYGTLRLQAAGGYGTATLGITVLGSGNVGINSNSPAATLDVVGDIFVSTTLTVNGTLNTINNITVNGNLFNYNTSWTTNGTSIYTMNNVGIGTTNPGNYPLNITGSMTNTDSITVNGSITSGAITCGAINAGSNSVACGSITANSITCTTTTINGNITTGNVNATVNGKIPYNFLYQLIFADNQPGRVLINQPIVFTKSNPSTIDTGIFMGSWGLWASPDDSRFYISNPTNQSYGVYLSSSPANQWGTLSDRRFKSNIHSIDYVLDKVLSLCPVTYIMYNIDMVGFIAQEVRDIFPHVISESDEIPDGFDSPVLSMSIELLIPHLIRAFQEEHTNVLENDIKITRLQYDVSHLCNNHNIDLDDIQTTLSSHDKRLSILEEKLAMYGL